MPKSNHLDSGETPMSDFSQKFDLTIEEGRNTARTYNKLASISCPLLDWESFI